MSTKLFGAPVIESGSVTLDNNHQFLEIRNITWAVRAHVYLVENDSDHNQLQDPSNRAKWIAQKDPVYSVPIGQSIRITGALKPGTRSILVTSASRLEGGDTKSLLTDRFEVSDYGEDTFLHGIYLTVNPNIRNQHKVEAVQFFHGEWFIHYPGGENGGITQVKMKLQHLSRRTDFSGEIFNFEGQANVRGEARGRSMTFTLRQGQSPAMTWELRIDDHGNWVGKNIMPEGEGPIAFDVDYLKKILYYRE